MRRGFFWFLAVCLVSGLSVFACSGGNNPEEYEGDATGECSDGVDNDRDGQFDCDDTGCAGSPDCGCTDQCSLEGYTECDGDLLRTCAADADGCLDWTEEDCIVSEMWCREGACVSPTGLCSASGDPCIENEDCPEADEVTGFCIVRDDVAGAWTCGFDTRVDTGSAVECEGQTVGHCESAADCPGDERMSCITFGTNWCGVDASGVCSIQDGAAPPCVDDSECTTSNTCVFCGDGSLFQPFEECDDGNTTDGDGCSSSCKFERVCKYMGMSMGCHCTSDTDCLYLCSACQGYSCECLEI